MSTTYNNPGGRMGPKTKTSKRTITNPDGTRTIITTTEVTTTNAFKQETSKKIDTQHLPSLPRVRRERVTMEDGTAGWRKTSTVVHPGGQREITTEHPNGEKEVKIEEGPKIKEEEVPVESIPKELEKKLPSWPSYPWDSTMKKLKKHAEVMPHKVAIAFLQTSGNNTPTISSSMTYQQLNLAVEYLASRLLPPEDEDDPNPTRGGLVPIPKDQLPIAKGDRILLVYPPCSPHFIIAFLACLRCGLVAVPVYPPHPDRKDSVAAFVGIARSCGARAALTNGEYAQAKRLSKMKSNFAGIIKKKKAINGEYDAPSWPEELIWVVTDREPLQNPPTNLPQVDSTAEPHETAFVQYTSGSTSAPKGVMLTHANLAHNLYILTDELDASSETNVVSWLPQYHDMGLIGSLIGVIYCGGTGYYMTPIAFLQRPIGWLEAVSEYRGTHLQAPNFAFGLTARKFSPDEYYKGVGGTTVNEDGKKVKPLDLSCLKHVLNGAEPVTEKSMQSFEKAFSPFGLPEGVIYPSYGLAEHTVFVCSGGKGKIAVKKKELEEDNKVIIVDQIGSKKPEGTIHFLGCGFPLNQNIDARIVDPVRRIALPDGMVGEIWISSPSKALGYYGKDVKETKMEFHALLEDMKESSAKFGGYLRSGDLGFIHKDQLYLCGRIKDLIIVGGRNHYPQDIEATAEEVASDHVRPGCSAAFSIGLKSGDNGEYEEVVLAMELKEPIPKSAKCESIADMVRAEVFKEHSLSLSCIVLVKPKTMPKTTSGKIQRSKAQQQFLTKKLQLVHKKEYPTGDVASFGFLESNGVKEKQPDTSPAPIDESPDDIRALDKKKIREMLLNSISQLAGIDASSIKDGAPLNSFMDSVTIAQLKGLLEGQYGVKPMSDGYLFNDSTTLNKLVEVVKVGEAKDDTGEGGATKGGGPGCCGCVVM